MSPDFEKALLEYVKECEVNGTEVKLPRMFYFGHKLIYSTGERDGKWSCLNCHHEWISEDGYQCPECKAYASEAWNIFLADKKDGLVWKFVVEEPNLVPSVECLEECFATIAEYKANLDREETYETKRRYGRMKSLYECLKNRAERGNRNA